MGTYVQFVGPTHALRLFGVKLVGVDAENGKKLLFTLALVVILLLLSGALRKVAKGVTKRGERSAFWVRQGIHLFTALMLIIGMPLVRVEQLPAQVPVAPKLESPSVDAGRSMNR